MLLKRRLASGMEAVACLWNPRAISMFVVCMLNLLKMLVEHKPATVGSLENSHLLLIVALTSASVRV